MSIQKKLASVLLMVVMLSVFVIAPTAQAQMSTEASTTPLVCDSTLVTLLLVAEHDYDYLSNMTMNGGHTPNIDLGIYKPLIDSIMTMMTSNQQMSASQTQMMATEEAQANSMMSMSDEDLMKMWVKETNMTGNVAMMTMLTQGDVPGEDPACSALRKDVQHFLLVHIVASMMHSGM